MTELPYTPIKEGIALRVRVQPRASRAGIEGVVGKALRVRLNSPPADGKANIELIELLSDALQIRKSDITIIKGHASRDKLIAIREIATLPEEVLRPVRSK